MDPVIEELVIGDRFLSDQADALRSSADDGWGVWLFTGLTGPLDASTPIDWIIEPSFAGYARQTTQGNTGPVVRLASGVYVVTFGPFSFNSVDPEPMHIAGYALVIIGHIMAAAFFAESVVIDSLTPLTFSAEVLIR